MKQIIKIILPTIASFSIAAQAFAWDFSASGSSTATYTRETKNSGLYEAKDDVNNTFTSSAGGVTASVSNSDRYANSVTFSYTADWNGDAGNFDEYVKISATKKVGNWTASTSTTQHMQKDVYPTTSSSSPNQMHPMQANNSAAFTLTDGSVTYKLGDSTHLSTAEKTVNGPMSGNIDAEARVDSFNGFSVGFSVGPGTLTVALDESNGTATTALGESDSLTVACGANATGFGINFAGDVGADLSFTYGMASATADPITCTDNSSSDSANSYTMGLGIGIPFGNMLLAMDLEYTGWDSKVEITETKDTIGGFEVSFTMPVGDATAGVNLSSQEKKTNSGGVDTAKTSTSGTEAWYTVPIGPVGLSIGYGVSGVTIGCSTCSLGSEVTSTTSQLGAEMTMSF